MSKSHLKRIALPRTWGIARKSLHRKPVPFASRPNSGKELGLSIAINNFLKDIVDIAKTKKEVKAMLQFKHVFVNGTRVRDDKFPVGLFDIVSFGEVDDCYRLILSNFGKLTATKIDGKEKDLVIRKIVDKTILKGGKIQLNLSNSANLIVDKNKGKVGDALIVKDKKIDSIIPLKEGCQVVLTGGRHIGLVSKIVGIQGNKIIIEVDGQKVETLKKHAFVVGDKKSVIKVTE